jgi:hypothetical protein
VNIWSLVKDCNVLCLTAMYSTVRQAWAEPSKLKAWKPTEKMKMLFSCFLYYSEYCTIEKLKAMTNNNQVIVTTYDSNMDKA